MHIKYLIKNYNVQIEITDTKIIEIKNNKKFFYLKSDINKVILCKSASLDKGGIPFSAMEFYYYIRIVLKSNEEIIITCLLIDDLDKLLSEFQGIKLERKKRFYCPI